MGTVRRATRSVRSRRVQSLRLVSRPESRPARPDVPPNLDPVTHAYLRGVDRTLLRENLRRTPTRYAIRPR